MDTTPDPKPDWPLIWARKFRKALYTSGKTGNGYTPVIQAFIREINYPPKYVKPDTIRAFIRKAPYEQQDRYREALSIFYNHTVPHDELKAVVEDFRTFEYTGNRKEVLLRKLNGTPTKTQKQHPVRKPSEEHLDAGIKTGQLIAIGNQEVPQNLAEPVHSCFTHIPTVATMSEKGFSYSLVSKTRLSRMSGKCKNYNRNSA